jgi:hypothetical protein
VKRARYLALTAVHALVRGAPLAPALQTAMAPSPAPRELRALAALEKGELASGLALLGLDPLVGAVAQRWPEETTAADAALARLPEWAQLARAAWRSPAALFVSLALSQLLVCAMLVNFVVPVLARIAFDQGRSLNAVTQLLVDLGYALEVGVWPLLLAWVAYRVLLHERLARALRGRLFWRFGAARVCAVAAVLVRAGHRPEEVLPALLAAEAAGPRAEEALSRGALDGPGLALLSETLAHLAEARAARIGEGLRVTSAGAGALVAALVLVGLYVGIGGLGAGGWGGGP